MKDKNTEALLIAIAILFGCLVATSIFYVQEVRHNDAIQKQALELEDKCAEEHEDYTFFKEGYFKNHGLIAHLIFEEPLKSDTGYYLGPGNLTYGYEGINYSIICNDYTCNNTNDSGR